LIIYYSIYYSIQSNRRAADKLYWYEDGRRRFCWQIWRTVIARLISLHALTAAKSLVSHSPAERRR